MPAMEITRIFYAPTRKEWRKWLEKNHAKEKDVWLLFYRKGSGKPHVSYSEAVQEAICFGWIDSTVKKVDEDSRAQRFTPRNPKSGWSELNKERARMMIEKGKMTKAGLAVLCDLSAEAFKIPADILKALKKDKIAWKNFQNFPESYKRIRIGFIADSRRRKEVFRQRLNYFLKMTRENKKYGMAI
jgi:uncharacterized protein YdeI (YjbR/CyaY-like superfamily)